MESEKRSSVIKFKSAGEEKHMQHKSEQPIPTYMKNEMIRKSDMEWAGNW